MGEDRAGRDPLLVGSVKTNIGHAEAAAGLAGLIKVVLSFSHGIIPKSLHFETPNPHVPWAELPVRIASEPMAWPVASGRRIAGVSSFGIGGTNAHVVLAAPPVSTAPAVAPEPDDDSIGPILLPLSAKTPAVLSAVAASYDRFLADTPSASVADLASTAAIGRYHFRHRAAVLACSREDARRRLAELAAGEDRGGHSARGSSRPSTGRGAKSLKTIQPRVLFFAPDIPVRSSILAADLFRLPAAAAALQDCGVSSVGLLDLPLAELVNANHARSLGPREEAVARFAIQYALGCQWRAWGVPIDNARGEGSGKAVAAALTGQMPLREALLSAIDSNNARAEDGDGLLVAAELELGIDAVLVLGPLGGVPAIEASCREAGIPCLPSLEAKGGSEWPTMMGSLGDLYVLGVNVDWKRLHASDAQRLVVLPAYPWQRTRHWPEAIAAHAALTPKSEPAQGPGLTLGVGS